MFKTLFRRVFLWVIKCCNKKKIVFQKELTLIEQVYWKNVCFVIIGTLKMLDLNLSHMFVINVTMMTAYELKSIAILNTNGIKKNEAITRSNNSVLDD